MRGVLPLLLLLAAPLASAQSPEQAYLAQRDAAIAALAQKWGTCDDAKGGEKMWAETVQARRTLEAPLRTLIGPVTPKGFSGPAEVSPSSLRCYIDSGLLDGLAFHVADKEPSALVIVTTEGLLRHWLEEHKNWWKDEALPTDPAAAFQSDAFYTQAISSDAHVFRFAPLAVRVPAGAAIAVALLVETSQAYAVSPPNQIAVSVVDGGRVYVALVDATTKLQPIAACDAVWHSFEGKVQEAFGAHHADVAIRLEAEGQAAFQKCWAERVKDQPALPAFTQQAQALVDGFAAR